MPPRPAEGMVQAEVLLRLRYAIDTASKYPTQPNIDAAIRFANQYPGALRSSHLRHNLGSRRWQWLNDHGVYPVGEPVEIAGGIGITGTITPGLDRMTNLITGPGDLDDQRWLDQQVATLGQGMEAAREIWTNWYDLRNVGRLHPGMSPGEYISTMGLRLTLAEAMKALPDGSTREIAEVAGVSQSTASRQRRESNDSPDARVIGADGKSYPGRVVGEVIEPEKKEVRLSKKLTLTEVRRHIRTVQSSLAMLLPGVVVTTAYPAIREFAPTLNEWLELWTPTEGQGRP